MAVTMKLKYFATYRDFTRCKEENVEAPRDVWELLTDISRRYGAGFRAKLITPDGMEVGEETIILVNGRDIHHLNGKNTPLTEADTVSIFPMVAGG
jgi:molybdopterin synthase sulfur carrier subunit